MPVKITKKVVVTCVIVAIAGGLVGINRLGGSSAETTDKKNDESHLLDAQAKDLPSINSIKAFDSGNLISDPAWFNQAYTAGFRLYILNTTHWGTCTPWSPVQPQIKNALAAGLKVAAYTRDPRCWRDGILGTGPYQSQLQFFALDIEEDPGIPVTRAMVDGVKGMGVRPVIYSGARMWPQLQGATANSFSDLPLWETDESKFPYEDWQVNVLWPTPKQFGGWNTASNMRIGIQQQFEYTLNDINVDLNSFNADFLK